MYYISCPTLVLEQPTKLSYKKKLAVFPLSSVNFYGLLQSYIWVKVFKNGPSTICWTQPLKNLKWYGLPKAIIHKFYLVHSWILSPIRNAAVPCFVFFSYHKDGVTLVARLLQLFHCLYRFLKIKSCISIFFNVEIPLYI